MGCLYFYMRYLYFAGIKILHVGIGGKGDGKAK